MTHARSACGVAALVLFATACGSVASQPSGPVLRIGAIFPLGAPNQPEAGQELLGVTIAKDMVNSDNLAGGTRLALDVRDVDTVAAAPGAAASLRADGVAAVIGAYSSALSIAASTAVAADGMVYWESGAVADQLTGRGLPLVFRVGADGADLGGNSGRFVVEQIAPRLGASPSSLRAFLVTADDAYAHSVSDGVRAALRASGVAAIDEATYDPFAPQWSPVLDAIRTAAPDVLLLSSHIPDGIAFRRAFVASGLHVRAFIGTSMAQCMSPFGDALGADAVGVFASDRPEANFNPGALSGSARSLYDRFAAAWRQRTGTPPTEEGLAGFSAAWALFHDVLPRAGGESATAIASAARALTLPEGSLPNGAGVQFATSSGKLGQNLRAAAVIWQWQAVRHSVVVWPADYATGAITMVPLPV